MQLENHRARALLCFGDVRWNTEKSHRYCQQCHRAALQEPHGRTLHDEMMRWLLEFARRRHAGSRGEQSGSRQTRETWTKRNPNLGNPGEARSLSEFPGCTCAEATGYYRRDIVRVKGVSCYRDTRVGRHARSSSYPPQTMRRSKIPISFTEGAPGWPGSPSLRLGRLPLPLPQRSAPGMGKRQDGSRGEYPSTAQGAPVKHYVRWWVRSLGRRAPGVQMRCRNRVEGERSAPAICYPETTAPSKRASALCTHPHGH